MRAFRGYVSPARDEILSGPADGPEDGLRPGAESDGGAILLPSGGEAARKASLRRRLLTGRAVLFAVAVNVLLVALFVLMMRLDAPKAVYWIDLRDRPAAAELAPEAASPDAASAAEEPSPDAGAASEEAAGAGEGAAR